MNNSWQSSEVGCCITTPPPPQTKERKEKKEEEKSKIKKGKMKCNKIKKWLLRFGAEVM